MENPNAAVVGLRQRRVGGGGVEGINSTSRPRNNGRNDSTRPAIAVAQQQQQLPHQRQLQQHQQQNHYQQQQQMQQQQQQWRNSHIYCFVSALLAILAIITSASSPAATFATRSNFNGGSKFLVDQHFLSSTVSGSGGNSDASATVEASLSAAAAAAESGESQLFQNPLSSIMASSSKNNNNNNKPVPTPSYLMSALDTEWWRQAMDFLFFANPTGRLPAWIFETTAASMNAAERKSSSSGSSSSRSSSNTANANSKQPQQQNHQPWPWRKLAFLVNSNNKQDDVAPRQGHAYQNGAPAGSDTSFSSAAWWMNWLDPTLFQANSSTLTDLIDKVLTSTPRLLAIANLLLALTYQMHTAVADWFLGAGVYPPANGGEWAMTGRERLGSFLVFKLLLISAVVTPDTLDLLILLSWYTLLSFLRSLAHLAAATTSHTTQSGQPPQAGVLQLLVVVLLCDFVAAGICAALFQLAGVGMVILLTCDCALLAVEVMGHILKHLRQVLEDLHENTIMEMENQQLQIHNRQRRLEQRQAATQTGSGTTSTTTRITASHNARGDAENMRSTAAARQSSITASGTSGEGWDMLDDDLPLENDSDGEDGDDGIRTLPSNNQHLLMEDSRRLDQSMDSLELAHSRRLAILDTTIFGLQLLVHSITVGHFLHIWTLHGIQFTLIDGVLALHLHSALSAASKQIAERRNLHRIARNLDGMFPNASELDLKQAHATGDVCCICLGAMSVGSVKKVGCGHLYHTNCLREVIERAHSMEAAKCPLCRASVVDGSRSGTNVPSDDEDQFNNRNHSAAGENETLGVNNDNNNTNNTGRIPDIVDPRIVRRNDGLNHRGERALFRFSTEGILPTWMPLPAFSFEVVRRPTPPRIETANNVNNANVNNNAAGRMGAANTSNVGNQNGNNQQSFFRRLLLLAGAVPLSPEEEARALGQLVDMFPQYDRADLLRELRDRGSAESVVEAVLLGVFSGRVRGSAGGEATPATANNPAADDRIANARSLAGARAVTGEERQEQVHNSTVDEQPPAIEVPA